MKPINYYSDSVEVIIYIVSLVGIIKFKSLLREIRPIFYFVLVGGATELFTDFYKGFIARNTMPIGHFYLAISVLLMALFFQKVLVGYLKKWILYTPIIAYIIYSLVNPFFIQSIWEFPNITGSLGALMLIVFSILLFTRIMTEAKINNLRNDPVVLANIAILFYYAGNFFYFILFNLNVEFSNDFATQVLKYYCILNDAFYIFVGIIFYKSGRLEKTFVV